VQVINAGKMYSIDIDIACLEEEASILSIHAAGFTSTKIKEVHVFPLISKKLDKRNKDTADHSPEISMVESVNKVIHVLMFTDGREGNMKRKFVAEMSSFKILLIVIAGNSVLVFKLPVESQQEIHEEIKGIAIIISVASQPSFCSFRKILHCHV
jgi:hypothetical protein